jgi:PIN domain nuclease of toxin-antitoxin system
LILLDTYVVIWWATGALERLSKEARVALEGQEDAAEGMLTQRSRLALTMEADHWQALASRLPEPFHADPADRFLVARGRHLGIPLMSADSNILAAPHVRCLW